MGLDEGFTGGGLRARGVEALNANRHCDGDDLNMIWELVMLDVWQINTVARDVLSNRPTHLK